MKHAKKLIALTLALICLTLSMSSCATLTIGALLFNRLSTTEDEIEFYSLVSESKELLDSVSFDINIHWGDYIYNDKYDSADDAIDAARKKNEDEVRTLEENDKVIRELYQEIRDGKRADEVEAVMEAYDDYYEFVMLLLLTKNLSYSEFATQRGDLSLALLAAVRRLQVEL